MASLSREVRRLLGKAISHYELIQDGDRISVAVSGGKDSLLLLWLLRERLERIPIRYALTAIHVDPGFNSESSERLSEFFKKEGFSFLIERTNHGVIAHGPENRENPCFLCARMRRATLFKKARELDCPKIAFGHNQDDFIETFFLNICYGGQVAAIVPKQPFFKGEIHIIRPLVLVPADKIRRLCTQLDLPVITNPCPSASRNKREEIRQALDSLCVNNPKVRGNIFHAMSNINLEYLPPPLLQTRTNKG